MTSKRKSIGKRGAREDIKTMPRVEDILLTLIALLFEGEVGL